MNDLAKDFMSEEQGREGILSKAEAAADSEEDTGLELEWVIK